MTTDTRGSTGRDAGKTAVTSEADKAQGVGDLTYLGSMPDLQSSGITALSYRSPLLATGLGNGKIFLWR